MPKPHFLFPHIDTETAVFPNLHFKRNIFFFNNSFQLICVRIKRPKSIKIYAFWPSSCVRTISQVSIHEIHNTGLVMRRERREPTLHIILGWSPNCCGKQVCNGGSDVVAGKIGMHYCMREEYYVICNVLTVPMDGLFSLFQVVSSWKHNMPPAKVVYIAFPFVQICF